MQDKPNLYLYWIGDIDPNLNKKCTRTITMIPSVKKLSIKLTESTFPVLDKEFMNEDKPDQLPNIEISRNLKSPKTYGQNATIYRRANRKFSIFNHGSIKILVNSKEISKRETIEENDVISFEHQIPYLTQSGEIQMKVKYLNFKNVPGCMRSVVDLLECSSANEILLIDRGGVVRSTNLIEVHFCRGKCVKKWPPCSYLFEDKELVSEMLYIYRYASKLTWINKNQANLLYTPSYSEPPCIQVLKLMEHHRKDNAFNLNLEPRKNKRLQFLVLHPSNTNRNRQVVAMVRNNFRTLVKFMQDNSPEVTIEYTFMDASNFSHNQYKLNDLSFGQIRSYYARKDVNQVSQSVLLFLNLGDCFEPWFNNIAKSLLPSQILIIGILHTEKDDNFSVMNEFLKRLGGYKKSLLPSMECQWRIWSVTVYSGFTLDLQELHTWFVDIYRKYS